MLATAVDLLSELRRLMVAVNTPKTKQGQIPKPWHWPRPHERKQKFSWRAIARQLGG